MKGENILLALAVLGVLGLFWGCRESERSDCEARGGELIGWRERFCVKPGSVLP